MGTMRAPGKEALPLPPQIDEAALKPGDLLGLTGEEDFSEAEAEGLRFSGQDASYAAGRGLELKECALVGCSLRGARLKGVSLRDVTLMGCDLSNAKLQDLYMQRVKLIGCKLVGTDMVEARLRNVEMADCVMRMVNLTASKLDTVRFTACDLTEAAMQMIPALKRVTLTDCDLTRAELMNTRLDGLDLTSCRIDGLMVTGAAELRGALVTPLQALALSTLLGIRIKE